VDGLIGVVVGTVEHVERRREVTVEVRRRFVAADDVTHSCSIRSSSKSALARIRPDPMAPAGRHRPAGPCTARRRR
jgi:hypothetical protein